MPALALPSAATPPSLDLLAYAGGTRMSPSAFDACPSREVAARIAALAASRDDLGEARRLEVKLAQRHALPLAAAVFGLLGCALGFGFASSDLNTWRGNPKSAASFGGPQARAYGAALALAVGYYALNVIGAAAAQAGAVPAWVGAGAPNAAGGAALVALLWAGASGRACWAWLRSSSR